MRSQTADGESLSPTHRFGEIHSPTIPIAGTGASPELLMAGKELSHPEAAPCLLLFWQGGNRPPANEGNDVKRHFARLR